MAIEVDLTGSVLQRARGRNWREIADSSRRGLSGNSRARTQRPIRSVLHDRGKYVFPAALAVWRTTACCSSQRSAWLCTGSIVRARSPCSTRLRWTCARQAELDASVIRRTAEPLNVPFRPSAVLPLRFSSLSAAQDRWVPVRFFQTARAGVFKQLVHRRKQY